MSLMLGNPLPGFCRNRFDNPVYLVHGIVLALLNVRTGGGKNGRWRVRRLG